MIEIKLPEEPVPLLTLSPGLCSEDHLDIFRDGEKGTASVHEFNSLPFDLCEQLLVWRKAVLAHRSDPGRTYELDDEGRALARAVARRILSRHVCYEGLDGDITHFDPASVTAPFKKGPTGKASSSTVRPQHLVHRRNRLKISEAICDPDTFGVIRDDKIGDLSAADLGVTPDLVARFSKWRNVVLGLEETAVEPQLVPAEDAGLTACDKIGLALACALKEAMPDRMVVFEELSDLDVVIYYSVAARTAIPVRLDIVLTREADLPPWSKSSPNLTLSPGYCDKDHMGLFLDDLTGTATAEDLLLDPALVERFHLWRDAVLESRRKQQAGLGGDPDTVLDTGSGTSPANSQGIDAQGEALARDLAQLLPEKCIRYVDMHGDDRIVTAPPQRPALLSGLLDKWRTGAEPYLKHRSTLLASARKGEKLSVSPVYCGGPGAPGDGLCDDPNAPSATTVVRLRPALAERFQTWREKVIANAGSPGNEAAIDREGRFLAYCLQWDLPRRHVVYSGLEGEPVSFI